MTVIPAQALFDRDVAQRKTQELAREIETLLGCTAAISFLGVSSLIRDRAVEDKYSKSLSELMTEVKDLADNFFKDRIPTSKILDHEFNQRAEDLKKDI